MSPVNTGAESRTAGLPEPLRKPCLRCLLREMPDQAQLSAVLRELIDGIPPEDRSPAALTESRLRIYSFSSALPKKKSRLPRGVLAAPPGSGRN